MMTPSEYDWTSAIAALLGFGLAVLLYVLPWIIADQRGVARKGWLIFTNIVFGLTVIGWIVALVWAILGETKPKTRAPHREGTGAPVSKPRHAARETRRPKARRPARETHRIEPHFSFGPPRESH